VVPGLREKIITGKCRYLIGNIEVGRKGEFGKAITAEGFVSGRFFHQIKITN